MSTTTLDAPGVVANSLLTSAVTGPYAALGLNPPATVAQQPAVVTSAAPHDSAESMVVAISSLVTSLVSPFVGNAPAAPGELPAMWTLMAAARRETFGTSPTLSAVGDPATNGLTTDAGDAATLATSVAAAQPAVLAIEQTPPLAWLQQLPLVGPVFVTPIVAVIHQIPIISDLLHPFIGYPVQIGLPVGTPVPRDVKVISFDGTPIYVHFMPARGLQAGQRAPTILNGPGMPLPGATNLDGALLDDVITDAVGQVSIATLRRAGYNVVTWDPRGEYNSGGVLELNSPDFEARDVSAIISWVATQPEAQLDSKVGLDPRMGMAGVSYGGGIQLVTAAIDQRVDAIVPTIAWNTLNSSLYKNEAFKSSWGTILTAALLLTGARANPRILPGAIYGDLTGMLTQADQDLLAERGVGAPRFLVDNITAPTLLIQGTVDTILTLQEADDTAQELIANGVPTKVLWFCGGHGLCLSNLFDLFDGALIERRTLEWLDRYVKREDVDTGPQFEWIDQRGQYFSSNVYPVAPGKPNRRIEQRGRRPTAGSVHRRLGTARDSVGREGDQRAEPHRSGRHDHHPPRRHAGTDLDLLGHRRRPPRLRPTRRRHHGAGAGQHRHPDPGDIRRADTHHHRSARAGGAHPPSGGDGDAAAGRLGGDLRNDRSVAGCAECVEHATHAADNPGGANTVPAFGAAGECGVGRFRCRAGFVMGHHQPHRTARVNGSLAFSSARGARP